MLDLVNVVETTRVRTPAATARTSMSRVPLESPCPEPQTSCLVCASMYRMTLVSSLGATISIQSVTKAYPKTVALDHVDLKVTPGEVMGLVGPNGSGKTTLLLCAAGLLASDSGNVSILGHDVVTDAQAAHRNLIFIPELPQPFSFLTPMEHLRFTARAFGLAEGWETRADQLLKDLALDDKKLSLSFELSKGQRQKIHLAMGMLRAPPVLLLDEPLIGIDPKGGLLLKQWIRSTTAAGGSVLVSSHSLALIEQVCQRVAILRKGKLLACGSIPELRTRARADPQSSFDEVFVSLTESSEGPAQYL